MPNKLHHQWQIEGKLFNYLNKYHCVDHNLIGCYFSYEQGIQNKECERSQWRVTKLISHCPRLWKRHLQPMSSQPMSSQMNWLIL